MDSVLRLPIIHNWARWASTARGSSVDVAENWRLLWAKIVESYSGTSAGKTSEQLEIEGIEFILDEFGQPAPLKVSLADYRKDLYRFLCIANSLPCEGQQLLDLLYTVLGPDVIQPLKFANGNNRLFHCGFNAFTLDEQSLTTIADTRKVAFRNIGGDVFMGLRSDANDVLTWPVTLPVVSDFSALTVRWIFSTLANSTLKYGPNNGDFTATAGAFGFSITAGNKVAFSINDGASEKTVTSNSVIGNNAVVEAWASIGSNNLQMYINGVLQASTATLTSTPPYYTDLGFRIGVAGLEFRGVNYEAAAHGETLTP